MATKVFFIHGLTPIHVGVGQGVGFVDLPIMREKTSKIPIIPGSSIKGMLADHYNASDSGRLTDSPGFPAVLKKTAFGYQGADHANSGSLVFTDAKLLFLPVRSLYGTFAWVTSPFLLERYKRDVNAGNPGQRLAVPNLNITSRVLGTQDAIIQKSNKLYFEDFDFDFQVDADAIKWARDFAVKVFPNEEHWQNAFKERFVIVHEDVFNFLCETGTEVITRIKIKEQEKVVQKGALLMEEALPAESILYGVVWCDRIFSDQNTGYTEQALLDSFCKGDFMLQVGGHATIGRGRSRIIFA